MSKLIETVSPPITDEWLKEIGCRWHEIDRSPNKHWVLALGDCLEEGLTDRDDLQVELTRSYPLGHKCDEGKYFCWLRGDYSHRYSRFLHVRMMRFQHELIRLIEGLTGLDWKPENVFNGALQTDKRAEYFRKQEERFDRRILQPNWNTLEKDESRGYPLNQHQRLLGGQDT